jgi:thermostable 8-oxoguanine DNA glycosylase
LISLKTEVDFPIEMEEFGEVLRTVEMRDQRRATLIAETAESSNQVKALIIHAEDSRILRDLAATFST